MLTLYGHSSHTAANILKIRAALAEAKVESAFVAVDLAGGKQHEPSFKAINPHAKVPVLVDGDFVLPESDAILWYIAESYPEANLLPHDPQGRARVLQWCDFASTSLYVASYEIYLHTSWGDAANHSAFVAERGRASLVRAMDVLEQRLAGRQFVATDAFTIADYGVAAVLHMLVTREHIKLADYPNTAAYVERIASRPAWQKAMGPL